MARYDSGFPDPTNPKNSPRLTPELRQKISQSIQEVGQVFGDPHQHRGLGLRQLARRSYEIKVHLQWRIVFIHKDAALIA